MASGTARTLTAQVRWTVSGKQTNGEEQKDEFSTSSDESSATDSFPTYIITIPT